jgi:enoyl-CoA hydratase/carnithine racemase
VEDRVRVEISEGIADVRLDRAEKLNALDVPMFDALVAAARRVRCERGVRAVVLSGEGRAFSAGLDFASVMATTERSLFERGEGEAANLAQAVAWAWRELPMPVIAAVHGVAYGGGLQIALGADIRFVAPDAKLSVREVHWGLVPDMSATQTLRHLVRADVAKELVYTAKIVSGAEGVALGLATHASETPRDEAFALAREIAACSPDAVRAAKRLLDATREGTAEEGLRLEEAVQRTLIGTPNQLEAVGANLAKREAKFTDPEPE